MNKYLGLAGLANSLLRKNNLGVEQPSSFVVILDIETPTELTIILICGIEFFQLSIAVVTFLRVRLYRQKQPRLEKKTAELTFLILVSLIASKNQSIGSVIAKTDFPWTNI